MIKALGIITLLTLCSSLQAMDNCPVTFGSTDYLEKVSNIISSSSSCYDASQIASACALGASGDVITVSAAIARCEKDLPVLSNEDANLYKKLNDKCDEKYSKLPGTLYLSMNAFCHLKVTELFLDITSQEE